MSARICPRRATAIALLCPVVQESLEDRVSRGVPDHGRAKAPTALDRAQATVRSQHPLQLDTTWTLGVCSPQPTSQGSPLPSPPSLRQQLYWQMLNPDNYSGPHNGPRPSRRPRARPAASLRQQKPPLPLRPRAPRPAAPGASPANLDFGTESQLLRRASPTPPTTWGKSKKSEQTLCSLPPASLCAYAVHKTGR